MSVGVAVGGWFASACIAKLADKVVSYISDQCEYESNVKHKLICLADDLSKIQGVLQVAEKRRIENTFLQQWLQDLKDASYAAEDVLDLFEYKNLEDRVEKTHNQVSSTFRRLSKRLRRIAKFILDDEVKELNDVVDKFRRITTDMEQLMRLISFEPTISEHVHQMMQSRETTSLCIESQLFCRDKERSYLIEQLLKINSNNSSSSSNNVHVLPLVGIGGVGKTTLAQAVYSNQNVKGHFDLKAWVCVSNDFDVKRLAKEIIESANISKPSDFHNLQNLDSILEIMKSGLTGRKFLIVLDDVWNEVASKWEKLQAILNFGEKGSRVVVTTRIQKIADMMGTLRSVTLEGLLKDDYWRFFERCVFGDKDPRDYQSLEPIGRQVAEKLGGNPLAAKTVGSVLKCNLNVTHWKKVLESKRWVVDQQEDGIMSVLRLSYDYLPIHLKQCFIYCSLFPQDCQFQVSELVRLWMAHGFIQSTEEEIGVEYIDELFGRSFFQKVKYSSDNRYVIHDLLHDLAKELSGGEIIDVVGNKPIIDAKKVRHVYVDANNLSLVCNDEYLKKNLRSLVVSGCYNNQLEMLKELRGLRVLTLNDFGDQLLPESVFAKMVHLRYLEIRGYDGKLPKSLGMLYHIQVIHVGQGDNHYEKVMPEEINRLISLRHLDAPMRGVARIGTLTLLRELSFSVEQRESGFEMGQLQHMSELRQLEIRGLGSVGSKQEACEAMLENKEHLKELTLLWEDQENADEDEQDEVLEGLRLHPNLEKLEIKYYGGRRIPQWWNESWASSCSYLQNITMSGCRNWEVLPPIGLLPHLKSLTLYGMKGMKRMGRELYGNCNNRKSMILFPSLETLALGGMPELMEWWKVEEDEYGLFPRLSYLYIKKCPKLRGPLFLPSQLKVLYVRIGAEFEEVKVEVYLGCEDVLQLIEWVPLQKLSSIEELEFKDKKMTRMGAELEEWFQHLTSLRSLTFLNCYELECLPFNTLLSSALQSLTFLGCSSEMSSATALQLFKIGWHKISHIHTIIVDSKYLQRQRLLNLTDGMYVQQQRSIKELTLSWEGQENADEEDDDVLEGLRPHHNLEKLTISHYHGHGSLQFWNGSWAASPHLQHIELSECPNWEVLPPFALLPHLKTLTMFGMCGVRQMGAESYGNNNNTVTVFRSLESLYVERMPELMEWWKVEEEDGSAKIELFPRLSSLTIYRCPKLRGPLFLPSRLKKLKTVRVERGKPDYAHYQVDGCIQLGCKDLLQLIEWVPLQNLSSIEELEFQDRKMTRMGAEWEEWFQHLSSLRSLTFVNCYKLECLPSSSSSSSTLQKLIVSYCYELESLPEDGLPTSLQELEIVSCSWTLMEGCSKDGREWHKISHIPNIYIEGEYVQRLQQRHIPNIEINGEDVQQNQQRLTAQPIEFDNLSGPNILDSSSTPQRIEFHKLSDPSFSASRPTPQLIQFDILTDNLV